MSNKSRIVRQLPYNFAKSGSSEAYPNDCFLSKVPRNEEQRKIMRIGIASDHGGYALKQLIKASLKNAGHDAIDFGAEHMDPADDYPDYVIPLARAVAAGEVDRGIALCGSGVGASIAANKIYGVRAGLIHDVYSAHQGVEDDDMNIFCLGGNVIGAALAEELINVFLDAHFSGADRHLRRVNKVRDLETNQHCL